MKDEHDKQTREFLEPHCLGLAPQGHAQDVANSPSPRELRLLKLEMDRGYRAREGLVTFLPVAMVAKEWRVTSRRVRALLSAGRLAGRQNENGYWEVCYPYTVTEGRRGPPLRRREAKSTPKKVELRVV